jgi:hypothetical protein
VNTEFQNGYLAGWEPIKGRERPVAFPMFDVPEAETSYLAGVALGVRDAVASISEPRTEPSIDDWLESVS